jgi:hypothetical protein
MAKLVLLGDAFAGRTYELNAEKTTVGRVEDNAFQIAEPSVSSHHAEIILRGNDVLIKDLNSTNGTFINGEKITESVLKPGQTLKFGQVELRLEGKDGAAAPTAAAKAPEKKVQASGQTSKIQRGGVKLNEFQEAKEAPKFQTTAFAKKSNKVTIIFISIAVVLALIIIGGIVMAIMATRQQ